MLDRAERQLLVSRIMTECQTSDSRTREGRNPFDDVKPNLLTGDGRVIKCSVTEEKADYHMCTNAYKTRGMVEDMLAYGHGFVTGLSGVNVKWWINPTIRYLSERLLSDIPEEIKQRRLELIDADINGGLVISVEQRWKMASILRRARLQQSNKFATSFDLSDMWQHSPSGEFDIWEQKFYGPAKNLTPAQAEIADDLKFLMDLEALILQPWDTKRPVVESAAFSKTS